MGYSKKIGVVVEVDGNISKIGAYEMVNDYNVIWNGEVLTGPQIGAYLTINQNDVKIIATVINEKISDELNTQNSSYFDNRFKKNSINRLLLLKTKGVITNSQFSVTGRYHPMIGNEVSITTKEELDIIYSTPKNNMTVRMGKSLNEDYPINISINDFYTSHIAIFGNTGSGKSNTLHKLYLELFKTKYYKNLRCKSQFFVIDFNGEYCEDNQFHVEDDDKVIYRINTRNKDKTNKLPIDREFFLNPDILSILFDAKPGTQIPFIKQAIKAFPEINDNFAEVEIGLLKRFLIEYKSIGEEAIRDWVEIAIEYGCNNQLFEPIDKSLKLNHFGNTVVKDEDGKECIKDAQLTEHGKSKFNITEIQDELKKCFGELSEIKKLSIFFQFQGLYSTAWNKIKKDHLGSLLKRISNNLDDLNNTIELSESSEECYKMMNIISLANANREVKRLIPMMLSKMIYDNQKANVSENSVKKTRHLIIDEAHNILNANKYGSTDDWQDYRISVFDEIIKEGRKFGFYVTLASQRPADISPTILSQVHNFFIHRLVNDNDLSMLQNTMPTLDKISFQSIPSLGQGEAIITGKAINVPILLKVDKELEIRPNSNDIEFEKFLGSTTDTETKSLV